MLVLWEVKSGDAPSLFSSPSLFDQSVWGMAVMTVDGRVGSAEFLPRLQSLGTPCELAHLEYADFAFLGLGEGGVPVPVGVERKTIGDFISSANSGRFAGHQLPGMLQCYSDIWLLIEGEFRPAPNSGLLEVRWGNGWAPITHGPKAYTYREFMASLLTVELKGGVRICQTPNEQQTAAWLNALYHWWVSKSFEEHRSHLRFRSVEADQVLLTKPSLLREIAALLPGIGWGKSSDIAIAFPSVRAMVQASRKEWMQIKGIGKTLAERIDMALGGEK